MFFRYTTTDNDQEDQEKCSYSLILFVATFRVPLSIKNELQVHESHYPNSIEEVLDKENGID